MAVLHPPINEVVEELLLVQFKRLKCGGMAIVLAVHRQVADGQCTISFLRAWSQLIRGLAVNPMPYHDRAAIAAPRDHPNVEFNHKDTQFQRPPRKRCLNEPVVNVVAHYSVAIIKCLKSWMLEQYHHHHHGRRGRPPPSSAFWAKHGGRSRRRGSSRGGETTHVRIAVSGGERIKPKVPLEYFGNFVVYAHPTFQARDLISCQSFASVTMAIRDSVSDIDDRYLQSLKDFGAVADGLEEEPPGVKMKEETGISRSWCPHLEMRAG